VRYTMAEQRGQHYYNSPYKFNGKELDEETGLYYYGARYYDPKVSIWLSVDPLAMLSPDKTPYHFVSNNPINRIDPLGLTDYKVNGETRTIDDGHNDVSIIVNERQFNRLQRKFDRGRSGYERMMNRMSFQNGFTTFRTLNNGNAEKGILNTFEIKAHKAGGDTYAEWSMKNPVVDAVDKVNNYYRGWEGSFATNAYKRAVITTASSAQLDGNTRVVNQMTGLSKSFKYSNAIGKAGPWVSGIVGVYNTTQGFQQDGGRIGYHTQRAALGSSLSIAGGYAGAEGGTAIRAFIGVWFGGFGAVPGAIIGGLIGGIGGGMLGQAAGEAIIDEVHK
jgi:RHS repeat-associated protein